MDKPANSRGNAGKGRPKGVPNKTTGLLKEIILQALDNKGGVDYLMKQADEQPVAFLALVGKVLPLQVDANHTGEVIGRIIWQKPE